MEIKPNYKKDKSKNDTKRLMAIMNDLHIFKFRIVPKSLKIF